eukprot:CAMPEP_0178901712 /NCGR_PEP_ID=MMETSP0786-20121207/4189_1 /TAXON_ID=186022 /ORGANISM="Thalassionema frauenfeldii, Strain CCMP 1798" /LENGTH=184 /DNA_ID=CAMNT_0020572873 /DNA_START=139 /DNA_END=693 /DNA_ORIENTATION=+
MILCRNKQPGILLCLHPRGMNEDIGDSNHTTSQDGRFLLGLQAGDSHEERQHVGNRKFQYGYGVGCTGKNYVIKFVMEGMDPIHTLDFMKGLVYPIIHGTFDDQYTNGSLNSFQHALKRALLFEKQIIITLTTTIADSKVIRERTKNPNIYQIRQKSFSIEFPSFFCFTKLCHIVSAGIFQNSN